MNPQDTSTISQSELQAAVPTVVVLPDSPHHQTQRERLSTVLPPLIFGTATFNNQYNKDPFALDTVGLVAGALDHGVRAFDTSPYYGPAEQLLGDALAHGDVTRKYKRSEYFILTKVGRIAGDEFDYSPTWVRQSVHRSAQRLHTQYLDVVYCHDVEFVSPQEVLDAVRELRRIRDEEGLLRYVGISGYPVNVLTDLAKLVLQETGEPLDAVMSYANYTLQNTTLASRALPALRDSGVDVVPNASVLGMGLLRGSGVPVGAKGDWHPAPTDLRRAVARAARFCEDHGEKLEVVSIRWTLERWLTEGAMLGSCGRPVAAAVGSGTLEQAGDSSEASAGTEDSDVSAGTTIGGALARMTTTQKMGISVIGVSQMEELEKTMLVWNSILDGLEEGQRNADAAGRWSKAHAWSINRRQAVEMLAEEVASILGEWKDTTWPSPPKGFLNTKK